MTGRALHDLIWKPFNGLLRDTVKVVLALDSTLTTVPLEILPYHDGILADDFTIAYTDSLSALAITLSGEAGDAGLVVVGGVDYDAEPRLLMKRSTDGAESVGNEPTILAFGIPRGSDGYEVPFLEGTVEESKAVARLYRAMTQTEPLLLDGAYASKASLIAYSQEARYLHIATHGYFAPDDVKSTADPKAVGAARFSPTPLEEISGLAPSLLCGIRLAGCNRKGTGLKHEGIITAEELQGLDLASCRLAVLSACDTNVGLVRAGQGIMSLQRALRIAGSQGSITSLWKVDDLATRLFFSEFYRLLWQEKRHPAEALRAAKLWLRNLTAQEVNELLAGLPDSKARGVGVIETAPTDSRPYASPYYWASFVYWGNVE